MVNATYFTYDGIDSCTFDLYIRQFDASSIEENTVLTKDVQTVKSPKLNHWFLTGATLGEAPTMEFSIISQTPLTTDTIRIVNRWLTSPSTFKELTFHYADSLENVFTFYGIFTSVSTAYVHGNCVGFNLVFQPDSPYARGASTVVEASCIANTQKIVPILNDSDMMEDYCYPKVTFGSTGIIIINQTDNLRNFEFSGLPASSTTVVDNELKTITNTSSSLPLQKFTSRKWLRLLPGMNVLKITTTTNTTVKIECPFYVLIKH